MTDFGAGTPVWIDLGSPDVGAAVHFYGELFGWTAPAAPGSDYTTFLLDGAPVAGVWAAGGDFKGWYTYLLTDDADETARLVATAGGSVRKAPYDVPERGRAAIFLDPCGAEFAVWEPRGMTGAGAFNVPGALAWNELATPDPVLAQRFYGDVFGWTAAEDNGTTVWQSGGRPIGSMEKSAEARWTVYVGVADADAAVAKATGLGATVTAPATDIPWGRFATLTDPQGAPFSLFQD
ncbi:VOC family protein [Catenuloplanes japonicus]|uniref:VOC family protein n=1 Tax=Catenuloplanes japonicus TaxID=33876 RepID=UPI000524D095|nr:VOC family protein [Catenuloplanes japonicus]